MLYQGVTRDDICRVSGRHTQNLYIKCKLWQWQSTWWRGVSYYIYIYIYIGALLCNVSCDSGEVLSGRDCVDHVWSRLHKGKTIIMLQAIVINTVATTVILVQITSSMNSIFLFSSYDN